MASRPWETSWKTTPWEGHAVWEAVRVGEHAHGIGVGGRVLELALGRGGGAGGTLLPFEGGAEVVHLCGLGGLGA
jgi:hypothetical protein